MEAKEMELVDVEYKKGLKGVLRIFINKAGGVLMFQIVQKSAPRWKHFLILKI